MCWFMLGCVAFSVYCHTGCAHKWKMRRICVSRTALDLAAATLCIEWPVGGSQVGLMQREACGKKRRVFEYGL